MFVLHIRKERFQSSVSLFIPLVHYFIPNLLFIRTRELGKRFVVGNLFLMITKSDLSALCQMRCVCRWVSIALIARGARLIVIRDCTPLRVHPQT